MTRLENSDDDEAAVYQRRRQQVFAELGLGKQGHRAIDARRQSIES